MTSWTANSGDSKTNSDSKHLVGGGGFTGGAQQSSGAVRLFCGAAQWWAHATALLFEPTEHTPPGGSPQVNCGLGVVMISVQVYSYNTRSALVQMSITGEVMYTCHGRGYMGKLLTFH